MAQKSGGMVPKETPAIDPNQAIATLSAMHHWASTKVNSERGPQYGVTITHAGKRVRAYRTTWIAAANAALVKLREAADADQPKLRIAR